MECENCGAPDAGLEAVRRVYLDTDAHGRMTGSTTMPDPEHWCVSCRTIYPNEPAGPGGT